MTDLPARFSLQYAHSNEFGQVRLSVLALSLLLAFTVLVRLSSLGDADYHPDESFYFLVGEAMHHGATPYVDIWDRKPPGLFAFYWLLAGFSSSVLCYQIAAIGFVTATGWIVVQLAGRWSDRTGALLAGALYIAWLQPLLGGGGQSPVFYNLFVAGAVLLLVRRIEEGNKPVRIIEALLAALLCGIAVTFKPTSVFEGCFVVVAFTVAEWRCTANWRKTALTFATLGAAAALPTLAGAGWYLATGHFQAYFQATIVSIFHKSGTEPDLFQRTAWFLLAVTFVLIAGAALGWSKVIGGRHDPRFARIMAFWLCSALAGFIAVPNFYSHYALPLVPVLAVSSAPFLATRPLGPVLAVGSISWALLLGQSFAFGQHQFARKQFDHAVRVAKDNMPNSTLYVFNSSPHFYAATGALLPTRFVFPEHLVMKTEAGAIGIDPIAEIETVLHHRPDVVIIADPLKADANPAAVAAMRRALARDYTLVCRLAGRTFEFSYHNSIFARNSMPDRRHCAEPAFPAPGAKQRV